MKTNQEELIEGESKKKASLEVRVAQRAEEWREAKEALGREHGLGAGREAGDRLCQLVYEEGKLAAVLVWCAAAWHLKARDEAVGWDAVTRSERLNLVVQHCGAFLCWKLREGRIWPHSAVPRRDNHGESGIKTAN